MMNNLNTGYQSNSSQSSYQYGNNYLADHLKDVKEITMSIPKSLPHSQYNIEKILNSIKDIKMLLHSYCLRIFDQSENYLESNKNKTTIDKTTEYNLNLIEVSAYILI